MCVVKRPLRSLRKGKYNRLCKPDRCPRLIVGATWRLDNAKSSAAMLQENSPDATCMGISYALGVLLQILAMNISVSKLVTTELLCLCRMTNRHGHCWVRAGYRWVEKTVKYTHSSVEP